METFTGWRYVGLKPFITPIVINIAKDVEVVRADDLPSPKCHTDAPLMSAFVGEYGRIDYGNILPLSYMAINESSIDRTTWERAWDLYRGSNRHEERHQGEPDLSTWKSRFRWKFRMTLSKWGLI